MSEPSPIPQTRFFAKGGSNFELSIEIAVDVSPWAGAFPDQAAVNAWWGGPQSAYDMREFSIYAERVTDETAETVYGNQLTAASPAVVVGQGIDTVGGATARAVLVAKSFEINNAPIYVCTWIGHAMTPGLLFVIVAIESRGAEFCTATYVMHSELAYIVRSISLNPPRTQGRHQAGSGLTTAAAGPRTPSTIATSSTIFTRPSAIRRTARG